MKRSAHIILGFISLIAALLSVVTLGYSISPHNAPLRLIRQERILVPNNDVLFKETIVGFAGGSFGSVLVLEWMSSEFAMSEGWHVEAGVHCWRQDGIMF